tara:strand:- start:3354 stop:5000 length:1647 start_codon:yes stop_codon:yes gene_type:complete
MKNENFKIGIYIRVSTQEQADNPEGSIKNQKDRLHEAVKFKNMQGAFGEIVDVFIDEAKSGKDTKRAELQRMLREIEKGEINLVMASELSRISRNIQDFAKIWNLMKEKGCSFYSLRENFDTTTAAGEMVLYTLANLSQFERRQVSERVSANFIARAKRGLSNGGPNPPGYRRVPGKPGYLEIDPEEAPIIKKCFEFYLKEETLASTAKRLNRENFRLKGGIKGGKLRETQFNVENLRRILVNKAVIGVRPYKENGEEKEAKAVWKGIIKKETFYKVQKILKENKSSKKKASQTRYPYILTGLVYCAECGDKLCGKSAHSKTAGKVGYYEHGWRYRKDFCKTEKMHTCSAPTRFAAKKVHELVIQEITKLIQDPKFAKSILKKAQGIDKKDPLKSAIKRLRNKKINIDRKLEMLTERLSELPSDVSATPLYGKMSALQKQKEELEKEIEENKKELKGTTDAPIDEETWKRFLEVFGEMFVSELSTDQQSKLIKNLIYKIELGEKEVKIHYFVGEDRIKKGQQDLSAGHIFLCPNFSSSSLTNGGRCKD